MTKSTGKLPPRLPWTEADTARLRALYPDHPTKDIASALGRGLSAVYRMAAVLAIGKSEAFKASELSGRILRGRQHPRMVASQIQKGAIPWNKGLHVVAGGRSAETRFKPGRPASESKNYVPIGSHRLSKDGYLERKVTDDPSIAPARRWTAEHRLVWSAANGPVPAGHVVTFLPGRRTAILELITLDALECVSRVELMRRNTVHQLPKEVAELVQLKGAIRRQVNRLAKESM